jgi:predicted nucleic acid-binding protein
VFTIDASIHINAYNPAETGTEESRAFLEQVIRRPWPVYSPTLLLVELTSTAARVLNSTEKGTALLQTVRSLPGQIWVPLDLQLAEFAAEIGAEYRLRGADAIYAAVAHKNRTTLVTRDRQQLDRLSQLLTVCRPAEALSLLA